MQIKEIEVAKLIPYANNSRTHDDAQVAQLAASIKEFGFRNPILVDGVGIIAGHGRLMAARKLGLDKVPTIDCSDMTEIQKKAYIIADNKLALNSGWDSEILRLELVQIEELGFALNLTGFSVDEIKALQFDDDSIAEMPDLKDGDKEPFQQKTFTLHDEQAQEVDNAITLARTNPLVDTGLNENTNGNAIALICRQWLLGKNGNC